MASKKEEENEESEEPNCSVIEGESQEIVEGKLKTSAYLEMENMGDGSLEDPKPDPRDGQIAVWNNNQMLVYGGSCGTDQFNKKLWNYDPSKEKWQSLETKGTIPTGVTKSGFFLNQGSLYIFGGCLYICGRSDATMMSFSNATHRLDLDSREWKKKCQTKGSPPSPRCDFVHWVDENSFFVFGDLESPIASDPPTLADCPLGVMDDLYVLPLITLPVLHWKVPETTGPMPSARSGCAYTQVKDLGILFGGVGEEECFNDLYTFHLDDMVWSHIEYDREGTVPDGRYLATLSANNSTIMICGGTGISFDISDDDSESKRKEKDILLAKNF